MSFIAIIKLIPTKRVIESELSWLEVWCSLIWGK